MNKQVKFHVGITNISIDDFFQMKNLGHKSTDSFLDLIFRI